jgi:hypothetical protein
MKRHRRPSGHESERPRKRQRQQQHETFRFPDLLPELQGEVLGHVTDLADRAALTRTCKQMHARLNPTLLRLPDSWVNDGWRPACCAGETVSIDIRKWAHRCMVAVLETGVMALPAIIERSYCWFVFVGDTPGTVPRLAFSWSWGFRGTYGDWYLQCYTKRMWVFLQHSAAPPAHVQAVARIEAALRRLCQ